MRSLHVFVIFLALLSAGCALTPEAAETVHPELRSKRPPLSPKEEYLKECTDCIQTAFQKQVDLFWQEAWRRHGGHGPTPRGDSGQAMTLIQAIFEIRSDGSVENLHAESVTGISEQLMQMIERAFAQAHLPAMPPAVSTETGGRLPAKVWVNDWIHGPADAAAIISS